MRAIAMDGIHSTRPPQASGNPDGKTKISIRNIRRDANKQLDEEQKSKLITEDDRDKGKKDIDNLTKEHVDKIDAVIKAKSEEILSN